VSGEDLHRQIVGFLAGEFARAENRSCIQLDLVSAQPGMKGDGIRTWDRKESPDVFEGQGAVENLATEIIRIAEEHAESYGGGNHRFELRTTQYLGGRQRTAFRIRIDSDEGQPIGSGSGEDAPTATGLVGQLMRHNEAKERVMVQLFQQTIGTMSRTMADMADENRQLRSERRDHLHELENAKSAELERELKAASQVAADERKDKALQQLYQLVPVVKARLLSAGQTDVGETPEGILIEALTGSLEPEQMAQIARSLSPNQMILLGELFKRANKKSTKSSPTQASPAQTSPASSTG